jgi:uncharacterized damage-inducible protein DinB
MDEITRLKKLFTDHYDGNPWLDINIVDTLKELTPSQAASKIGDHNSIWQIVQHVVAWRETNLARIQGELVPAPSHNFIEEIQDKSEAAWEKLLGRLQRSQEMLLAYLEKADAASFDTIYKPNQHTYYEHLQGILQHDAYHLGQIVLLKKLISNF